MLTDNLRALAELDRVIHEPLRLLIMSYLSVTDCADFVFLQRELKLTHGNLSQHITKLETAGYVAVEKSIVQKKTRTVYRLTPEGRRAFEQYKHSLHNAMAVPDGLGDVVAC